MIRIASGTTDQYVYFTAPPGLSSFTVYASKNGAAAAAFTTPTVNETDSTNMPGRYELLLDEQTTVASGNLTEHLALYVSAPGWSGTHLDVELFEPANYSVGLSGTPDVNVAQISGDAAAANNLEADYDGTGYNKANSTIGTCTSNTDMRGTDDALLAASAPSNFGDLAIAATTGKVTVGTNDDKSGYSIATGGISASTFSAGAIDAAALAADAVAEIADGVLDEDLTGHQGAGSLGAAIGDGDNGAGLSAIPWNSAWDAEVQSEVNDALVALHLDHLFAANYDPAAKPGTATALLNELVENDGGVSRFTANALEQALQVTISELGSLPSATPSVAEALMLLYMALRNKRDTTSSSDEIHNDAGTAIATAAVSDDGTTFSKGKYA